MNEPHPDPIASANAAADPHDRHVWSLTRDRSIATCWQRWIGTGVELRVDVEGVVRHRRVLTSRPRAMADSLRWRTLMMGRGWTRA